MVRGYPRGVATNYPRPGLDTGVLRDILALLLVLSGVVGLTVVGFATDWRLGVAVLSVAVMTAGVLLGYER